MKKDLLTPIVSGIIIIISTLASFVLSIESSFFLFKLIFSYIDKVPAITVMMLGLGIVSFIVIFPVIYLILWKMTTWILKKNK
jgi:hypothetical protein